MGQAVGETVGEAGFPDEETRAVILRFASGSHCAGATSWRMTPPSHDGVRPASPARPRARPPRARRVPGRGWSHDRSRHGRRRRAPGARCRRRRGCVARARSARRLRADRRARRLQPGAGRWQRAEQPRAAPPLGRRPAGPRGARRDRGHGDAPPGALPRRRPGGRGAHRVDRLGPRHPGGRRRRGGSRARAARGRPIRRDARAARRRPSRRPHPPHRRERLHRGPARGRRRGRQHERPHDAAPRRGRGARGPPRGLPPLPDPRRQPVREARAAERRRRRACERHAGGRPDGAPRLPPASPHRAAGRARHRARRRAADARLRSPMRPALALLLVLAGPAWAAEEATVALNFQDVELPVLAKFVSEVTGRNFIVDDRVRGKVTIISPTRITPDEAYLVFQSVLQVKGFTTVPSGAFTKIVPAREARETTVPTGARAGEEVVTRILPLRHADAGSLVPVLQPLVSKDGLLSAYPVTNSLVIVDAGANVERLAALLDELDVAPSGGGVEVVPLRFAPADDLAPRVRDAFAGAGRALRVVADSRSNALVL